MKPLLIRRVVGDSMLPALKPGKLVVASAWFRRLHPGQVVIITHDGLEKIKRIEQVDMRQQRLFVAGDNPEHSTDSRHFGWLPLSVVVAIVRWPRV